MNQEVIGIRAAIGSEQYEEAMRLWNAYATKLQEELLRHNLSGASLQETRDLVEWSRVTLLCARAHSTDQLNQLHVAGAYGTSGGANTGLLQLSF